MKTHRPDVVISPHIEPYRWLGELRTKGSAHIGSASREANPHATISGVSQQFTQVGILAVDLLHQELTRGAYGVPATRHSIAVDGSWVEGTTLRPRVDEA